MVRLIEMIKIKSDDDEDYKSRIEMIKNKIKIILK